MDPFEARLAFIKNLQKLNGSIQANDVAVQFLLKHAELRDDLYSCILQQLDRVSIGQAAGTVWKERKKEETLTFCFV